MAQMEEGVSVAETLSEELLLAIFRFLGPRTLVLSVGLVSKRWRRVSRDPRLWERLTLVCYGRKPEGRGRGRGRPAAAAPGKSRDLRLRLLRQAPCLDFLNLRSQLYTDAEVRLLARVAPARIRRMYACFHKEHNLAELLPVLEKTRDHLRDLTICREGNKDSDDMCEEFWEWFDSSRLERLTLLGTNLLDTDGPVDVEFQRRGFLRYLKLSTHAGSGGLLASLLRAHSASLRAVEVKSFCCGWTSEVFSALAQCRHLESVFVPSFTAISKLNGCTGLKTVAIEDTHNEDDDEDDQARAGFPDALSFLTMSNVAAGLTSLGVHHVSYKHQLALFEILPQLTALTAFAIECCTEVAADGLAETLRQLKQLRDLSFRCVHDLKEDVLAAISVESVPLLRALDLSMCRCDEKGAGELCWEDLLDTYKERMPKEVNIIITKHCVTHKDKTTTDTEGEAAS